MRLVLLIASLCAVMWAAPTTVRQRLYTADGSPATGGTIQLEVVNAFTALDGTYVPAQTKTYLVAKDGWATLPVVANIGSTPVSWYNVRITLPGSTTAISQWQVPVSSTPVSITSVTINTVVVDPAVMLTNLLTVAAAIDVSSVPDGSCVLDSTAVTLTGAALGGKPIVGASFAPPVGIHFWAKVTGPNTVKIEICNSSGSPYDPALATYYFGVQP